MFCNFAVCTAVFVALHSNDALALQQGNSMTPSTGARQDDVYTTAPGVTTSPSAATTPTLEAADTTPPFPITVATTTTEEGLHSADCDPHFPTEPIESSSTPSPALTPPPGATPVATNPPPPETATPAPGTGKDSALNASPASTSDVLGDDAAHSANQVNTQSTGNGTSKSTGTLTLGIFAVVAAVAAVGTAASRMKKSRENDLDAALATPGDSHIHIEIKHTPTGGSTIL